MSTRIVELRRNVLNKNDGLARALRDRFQAAGVTVFNWVSGPGTGKTELLKRVMLRLREQGARVAALVGDLETDNDARRLAESGAPVRQIQTHTLCHLEAEMIERHLEGWDLASLDFLFIENVGNLVCPAGWDLGEQVRVVLLSATEGEDKPLKYPKLFHSADVAVITKIDLAEACEFDRALAESNLQSLRPEIPIYATSAKRGTGVEEFCVYLAACAAPNSSPPLGGNDGQPPRDNPANEPGAVPERARWHAGPIAADLPPGQPFRLDVAGTSILLLRSGGRIRAFRNSCPHRGLPLDGAFFDGNTNTLTCPWHGFCFDANSGACFNYAEARLDSFPVRMEEGRILVGLL